MNTRISQVFRDADGKVQRIVCGKPPEDVAEFERVEIADQIFFRKVGSDEPYRKGDIQRSLEPVRSI